MADYVEQGEIKQLIVQRKDGSTWTAEIGIDGRVRLLQRLHDPTTAPEEEDDQQLADQAQQGQQQNQVGDQQQADQQDGQEQEGKQDDSAWGEAAPPEEEYDDTEIDKLIQDMENRHGGSNETKTGVPPRLKLDDNYWKKLKDTAFNARLSSIMLDNKYSRRLRGRTRGKLDMSRLFKVPTHSRSVFTQKQERKGKQYNVVLLVDESYSMVGRKSEVAAETALFLTRQFENLNINIGIIGYSDNVHVHKELNNSKVNYHELLSELSHSKGGTNDYAGLRRAYHMFHGAPEGQNILIMLSDGSPGDYRDPTYFGENGKVEHIRKLPKLLEYNSYGDILPSKYVDYNEKDHLHHLVKAHPEVAAIGIGIQQGGWQIPEHFVIHNINDLKSTVLKVLKRNIKRG